MRNRAVMISGALLAIGLAIVSVLVLDMVGDEPCPIMDTRVVELGRVHVEVPSDLVRRSETLFSRVSQGDWDEGFSVRWAEDLREVSDPEELVSFRVGGEQVEIALDCHLPHPFLGTNPPCDYFYTLRFVHLGGGVEVNYRNRDCREQALRILRSVRMQD